MNPETTSTAHLPWKQKWRLRRRNFEHQIRDFLLAVLRAVFLRFPRKNNSGVELGSESFNQSIQKILIIRTGKAIGDAVMSLALIPQCRSFFPSAKVDFLLRDNVVDLFKKGAGIDTLLELHPRFLKWPRATWQLLRNLRKRSYDLVIACDNPLKSSMTTLCLALWTRAQWRVGFENEESRPFLNIRLFPEKRAPTLINLLRLLSPFGNVSFDSLPKLIPPAHFTTEADSIVRRNHKTVIIFVSSHWRKSWPVEAFLRVATKIIAHRYHVILAFGPGDDRITSEAVQKWIQEADGLGQLLPPQKLALFAAILARCDLFISNDCGPYHIAVSLGVHCIAAFQTREAQEDFGYQRDGLLTAIYHPIQQEAENQVLQAAIRMLPK